MRRWGWCLAFFLVVSPGAAAEPQGKLVKDLWDAAYLEGQKAGYFHTTVQEIERDGQQLFRSTVEMNLTIKRFNTLVKLRMDSGTEETVAGKVTAVFMRQYLDKGQQLVLAGTVIGDRLHVKVDGGRIDRKIPWNDEVVGLYRQERLFQEHRARPGIKFTYMSFEPSINALVTVRAVVKNEEEVDLQGVKKRLLRVEAVPDKIEVPGTSVQLPPMVSWLGKDLLPVRSLLELQGVGKVNLYRTTAELARAEGTTPAKLPDLGLTTLIPLNKTISRPHDAKSAVYRITVKNDDDPTTAFAQDGRQSITNVKGSTFDLRVQAVRGPKPVEKPPEFKEEFLKSCYYLNSDDARVKEHARRAVGAETDPWRKAQSIELWVHNNMRKSNSTGFGTAAQVALNLEGDCRQHALLTAAMCRAAGVPSRTAVGLVYVNDLKKGPVMGFHMWTEVGIKGQWIPIDATLAQGSIGAGHIKIADNSWHDTQSLTPLLPVARVLGKVSIEVVSVNGAE